MGNSTDHTPHKWTFPLLVKPGMVMVRNQGKRKTYLFGPLSIPHQVIRSVLFTGESIAKLHHGFHPSVLCCLPVTVARFRASRDTQSLCQLSCSRVPSPSGLLLSLTA